MIILKTNKSKYYELCSIEDTIPLFSQYWWMDTICEDNWDVIIVEENNKVVASLPYFITDDNNRKEIKKATLTQNNGIWIKYPENLKYEKKLSYEKKVMNKIIDNIELLNLKRYQQYFHYSVQNWLPFYWRGFSQTTRYTYVIENISNLEEIISSFNPNIRNQIRKAKKSVSVSDDMSIENFYAINKMTFTRQGIDMPYSVDLLKRLDNECVRRKCRKILFAFDKDGNIHSAAYFVFDNDSIYYLMSGSNPDFRHSQSLTLLIFEGIKIAHSLNKKFDFEGSMKENIENFFRQFGAKQKSYYNIYKDFN